jgi:anti-sigma factor RsiW
MNDHLTPEQFAEVAAGLELDPPVREHLASCVACRGEIETFDELVAARRREMAAEAPDWRLMAEQVEDRLPADAVASRRRPRWLRPMAAVAAVALIALGIGVLKPRGPEPVPSDEVSVEEILAEMDELLSDDTIPGFEIIDPETDELTTYFDNGAS